MLRKVIQVNMSEIDQVQVQVVRQVVLDLMFGKNLPGTFIYHLAYVELDQVPRKWVCDACASMMS